MKATDFQGLITLLVQGHVAFVIIGGVAGIVHGSAQGTYVLDICYERSAENIARLCQTLVPIHPVLRGAPEGLPFRLDPPTVRAGLNFTLDTDLGALDLLGEVSGLGTYPQVVASSEEAELVGLPVRVLSLDALIRAKRAAGRGKDLLTLPELEALRALQDRD